MEPAETPESPAPVDATQDRIVVLHVDDDGTFRSLAADYVQTVSGDDDGTPIEVLSADSGVAALQRLEEVDVDCVVSDYAMPGMTGLELIETVSERWPDLPFILLTGKGSEEIASEAVRAGVDDYMQKQSGREQFELLVNRIRSHVSGMHAKESYEELFETATVGLTVHDPDSGAFLSANERACELVRASEDELRGMTLTDILAEGESVTLEDAKALIAEVAGGASRTVEWHVGEGEELTCIELVLQPAEILGEHRIVASIFDITSAKKHKQALEAERTRFRRLVEQVDEYAILMLDTEGNIASWNEGAEKIKGYKEEEILGEHVSVFYPEEDVEAGKAERLLAKAAEEGTVREEAWRLRKDGSRFWANVTITALTDEEGELTGFTKVTRDLTGERERQRRYEAVFDHSYQFTGVLEPDGTILEANRAILEFSGSDREDAIGEKLWDTEWFGSEESRDIARFAVRTAREGEPLSGEVELEGVDGTAIVDFTITPIVDDEGEVVLLIPEGRDVTEEKSRKEELEQANTRFEAIADSIDAAIWLAESDPQDPMTSEVVYVSPKLADLLGADPDAVEADTTQTWIEHVHPDDRERVLAEIQDEATGAEFDVDYRVVRDDGTVPWLNTRAMIADSGDPDTQLLAGITQDVTDDVEQQEDLEQSRQRFQAIAEVGGQSVWVIQPGDAPPETAEFAYVSPGSFRAFDIDPEDGDALQKWFASIHPDDQEQVIAALDLSKDPDADFETEYRVRVGGTYRWFQSRGSWLHDGAFDLLAGVTREVTDRKEHDRALEAADAVFENVPDVMFLYEVEDGDTFRVRRANPAYAAQTEFDADELPGKTIREALGEEFADQVIDDYRRCVATAEVQTYEESISSPGTAPHWRTTLIPVAEDGEVVQILGIARDVTQQKKREQELRAVTDRLRTIVEASPEPIVAIDTHGKVEMWNPAAERVFGWTKEEMLGRRLECVPDDLRDEFREILQRVEDGGTVTGHETERLRKDGERIDVSISAAPLRGNDGAAVGQVAIVQDISERKQREAELERVRGRTTTITETIADGVFLTEMADPPEDSEVVFANPAMYELFEIDRDIPLDGIMEAWMGAIHPDDIGEVAAELEQMVEDRDDFDLDYRVETDDGDVRWFRSHAHWVGDPAESELVAGVITELTEQKEHEQELAARNEQFDAIARSLDANIWLVELDPEDPQNPDVLYVNPALADLLGVDPSVLEENLIETWLGMIHPDDRDRVMAALSDPMDGIEFEYRLLRDDGTTAWLETRGRPVNLSGERNMFAGVTFDVTEYKEREIRYQEAALSFEHAEEPMFVVDTAEEPYRFANVNPAFADVVGVDRDRVEGEPIVDATGEEFADAVLPNYRRCVATGEVQNYEEKLEFPGVPTYWRTTLAPVFDDDGEVVRVVGIARNITDAKMREDELQFQNKRLDDFASIVSHDLRNPLTVAQGNAELLEGKVEDEAKLEAILESLNRAAEIIEDTLVWARTGQAVDETETTDLAELAQQAWDGVQTEDARVVVEAEGTVECDASLLQQLLENLFVNAVQHAGSDVTVTVGDLDDGFYVEDDGPGIPAEHRDEVFEGGYTTDEEGLGFGLSIVNQIAKAHDWRLEIVDAEGGGARFEIRTHGGLIPV